MKYEIFSESFSHSRRSQEHVINLLNNRVDRVPGFTLFLGAGASVTSGIRAAGALMEEWRRRLFAAAGARTDYETWMRGQEWFGADDEYSLLFERVYDQPSQRRAYIENVVNAGKPSWGYAYLASLIEHNVFNTVFTTNFDDLANEACFQYSLSLRPMVCAHDSAVASLRVTSTRPKIVKLHGDFLYDSIKNTSSELQNLEFNMRDKLVEFAKEFGMIVIGYAGADKSIMDTLDVLVRSSSYFRNGIYWCVRRGSTPGPRLRQLLRNDRVYWLEVDGFDEFTATAAHRLQIGLPLGVTAPHIVAFSRCAQLFDGDKHDYYHLIQTAHDKILERHDRVSEALKAAGMPDVKELQQREPMTATAALLVFEAEALPYLQVDRAIEAKDYLGAAAILQRNIAGSAGRKRQEFIIKLLYCLLEAGDKKDDILTIAAAEASQPGNSDHFTWCAYYVLFLNEAEMAFKLATRALELNPGSGAALLNQALAYLQLGDEAKVKEAADTLTSQRMPERFRAAGYAMQGDFEKMAGALQAALACNDYSVRDAFRDVVFRPYWTLQAFVSVLRPFSDGEPLTNKRAELYPMSAAEEHLRARIEAWLGITQATQQGVAPDSAPRLTPVDAGTVVQPDPG